MQLLICSRQITQHNLLTSSVLHHFDKHLHSSFICTCCSFGVLMLYESPCVLCVTALTAHLNQAPPLQYDSYVLLPEPASHRAVNSLACIYSHNPFTCLTISRSVCLFSLSPSLPDSPALPPSLPLCRCTSTTHPHPPRSFAHRLFLRHTHTHTHTNIHRGTCCASLDQSTLTTVCLQKSSFSSRSLQARLFFSLGSGLSWNLSPSRDLLVFNLN
ncbi:hypothetical protein AMECASPLE_021965 [Ameca splendens]|uniref:Uncharacterized protein n=1 Tax=Ameca splendens TaxID=208324 RepID=A0ABV0YES8_9TELE